MGHLNAPEVQILLLVGWGKRRFTECVAFVFCAADVFPENTHKKTTHLQKMKPRISAGQPTALASDVPGDEQRGVVVGGMAVVLDILALLPDAEVVQSRGSVEAHGRSFLLITGHQD